MDRKIEPRAKILVALGTILSINPLLGSDPDTGWEMNAAILWESRYVAEGRSELEDGGIFSAELVAARSGFELGLWTAAGHRDNYRELNLTGGYGSTWQGVDWGVGYTHLEFGPDSADDDELSGSMVTGLPGGFDLRVGAVYSFEADGTFLQLALSYPFDLFAGHLQLEPYLLEGLDFGYRTAGHDGLNHMELGIEGNLMINDRLSLIGYIRHSFAQTDVKREGLGDVSWAGVGLSLSF